MRVVDVSQFPVTVQLSGKEQAHKHKQVFAVTAWVRGVSRPGGQGSNVYVLCAEAKEQFKWLCAKCLCVPFVAPTMLGANLSVRFFFGGE